MSETITSPSSDKIPQISVCITSYNHAEFIGETLDSILAQTFQDFEVVIVDDGSTDNSLEILKEYSQRYPQIKVFTHPNNENRGISITINAAIEKSRAPLIAPIASDDLWLPNHLELLISKFNENPSWAFVYSKERFFSKDNENIREYGTDTNTLENPVAELLLGNYIPSITILLQRKHFIDVGAYDENLVYQDWELWIRLLAHFDAGFVNEVTAKHRVHSTNTSMGILPEREFEYSYKVLTAIATKREKIGGRLTKGMVDKGIKSLYKGYSIKILDVCFHELEAGKLLQGIISLSKAFQTYPLNFLNLRRLAVTIKYLLLGFFRSILYQTYKLNNS